jgi:hypothetical protein
VVALVRLPVDTEGAAGSGRLGHDRLHELLVDRLRVGEGDADVGDDGAPDGGALVRVRFWVRVGLGLGLGIGLGLGLGSGGGLGLGVGLGLG